MAVAKLLAVRDISRPKIGIACPQPTFVEHM
jgi:hypothetical protein